MLINYFKFLINNSLHNFQKYGSPLFPQDSDTGRHKFFLSHIDAIVISYYVKVSCNSSLLLKCFPGIRTSFEIILYVIEMLKVLQQKGRRMQGPECQEQSGMLSWAWTLGKQWMMFWWKLIPWCLFGLPFLFLLLADSHAKLRLSHLLLLPAGSRMTLSFQELASTFSMPGLQTWVTPAGLCSAGDLIWTFERARQAVY